MIFACWSSSCAVCQVYCCPPQPQSGSMGTRIIHSNSGVDQKLILILIRRVSVLTIDLLTGQSESLPVQAKQLCERLTSDPAGWGFCLSRCGEVLTPADPALGAALSLSWLSLSAMGEPPGPACSHPVARHQAELWVMSGAKACPGCRPEAPRVQQNILPRHAPSLRSPQALGQ